jgi:hypothetical protein
MQKNKEFIELKLKTIYSVEREVFEQETICQWTTPLKRWRRRGVDIKFFKSDQINSAEHVHIVPEFTTTVHSHSMCRKCIVVLKYNLVRRLAARKQIKRTCA